MGDKPILAVPRDLFVSVGLNRRNRDRQVTDFENMVAGVFD